MGVSILSVIEIIYWLHRIILGTCESQKTKKLNLVKA